MKLKNLSVYQAAGFGMLLIAGLLACLDRDGWGYFLFAAVLVLLNT